MSNSYTEMIMNEFDEYNCDIIEVKEELIQKNQMIKLMKLLSIISNKIYNF